MFMSFSRRRESTDKAGVNMHHFHPRWFYRQVAWWIARIVTWAEALANLSASASGDEEILKEGESKTYEIAPPEITGVIAKYYIPLRKMYT